jgi:hypothetical protein
MTGIQSHACNQPTRLREPFKKPHSVPSTIKWRCNDHPSARPPKTILLLTPKLFSIFFKKTIFGWWDGLFDLIVCSADGCVKTIGTKFRYLTLSFLSGQKDKSNNHWDTHTHKWKEQTNKLWKLLAMNEWLPMSKKKSFITQTQERQAK